MATNTFLLPESSVYYIDIKEENETIPPHLQEPEHRQLKIEQFFYGGDNLGYLLYSDAHALAIDGGAVDEIETFLRKNGLTLSFVTNTHGHGDHTMGTKRLEKITGARYLDHRQFKDEQTIEVGKETVSVRLTPGHTSDSVTFATNNFLITGDTLFNGTVGNCFSGDLEAFYRSIRLIMGYPESIRIYAGHDYVKESLAFARQLTSDQNAIDKYEAQYDALRVVSTLKDELSVNPYLRFNEPETIARLKAEGLPTATEYQRWESIMSIG